LDCALKYTSIYLAGDCWIEVITIILRRY